MTVARGLPHAGSAEGAEGWRRCGSVPGFTLPSW